MVDNILTLVSQREQEISEDVTTNKDDPLYVLVASLATVSSGHDGGKYRKIIESNLNEANRGYLVELCDHYHFRVV